MAKLSLLEKEALNKFFHEVDTIRILYLASSDTVNDIIYNQIDTSLSNKEDNNCLQDFLLYSKNTNHNIQNIIDSVELLKEHFIGK